MFCSECGTKNEEGSLFCENCGTKIEQPVVKNEKPKKVSKKTKKKNNKLMYIIIAVVVVLVGAYLFLNNMTSPKNVAKGFFEAVASADADKLYDYMDVEESEFTTKKIFKDKIKNSKKIELTNYTVGNPLIAKNKLSATVKISYLLDGEYDSEEITVKLIKDKKKKWLLFDNWKINTKGYEVVKNFEFRLPKESKLEIEGIKVKDKYLKKDSEDKNLDIYVIPSMFESEYNIKVTLPIGLEIKEEVNTSSYYSYYTVDLSEDNLTDELKKSLQNASKTALENIYNSAKDKKSWDDVKSKFEYKGGDVSDVKKAYENLVKSFTSSSSTLTSLSFTKIDISNVSLTDEGYVYVSAKASYDFTVSYQSGDETKTNDSDDYDYVYLTFDYNNKEFKLVDASSLNSYYSKYY